VPADRTRIVLPRTSQGLYLVQRIATRRIASRSPTTRRSAQSGQCRAFSTTSKGSARRRSARCCVGRKRAGECARRPFGSRLGLRRWRRSRGAHQAGDRELDRLKLSHPRLHNAEFGLTFDEVGEIFGLWPIR